MNALWYLVSRSLAGKVRRTVGRLREPRYLLGLLFGGAYVYFFMIKPYSAGGELSLFKGTSAEAATVAARMMITAGVLLLAISQIGSGEEGIAFRDEELAFLLAAPLSRNQLKLYRLLDAQPPILLFALFLGYGASQMPGGSWLAVLGAVLLLELMLTLRVFWALSLGGLRQRGWSPWWLRGQAVTALLMLAGATWVAYRRSLAAGVDVLDVTRADEEGPAAVLASVGDLIDVAPLSWVLWVPQTLAALMLPQSGVEMAVGCAVGLALLGLLLAGIFASGTHFEQASLVFSRRVARIKREGLASERGRARPRGRRDYAPFALAARGPQWVAIAWKNGVAAGPIYSPRNLLLGLVVAALAGLAVSTSLDERWQALAGVVSFQLLAVGWILLSQRLQHDLRGDLGRLALIRSLPIDGPTLLIGETVGTAAIVFGITAVCWTFGVCALGVVDGAALAVELRLASYAGGLVALGGVTLAFFAVGNALTMMFPAWSQKALPGQGVAALGQNLLAITARMIGLTAMGVPAVLIAAALGGPTWALLGQTTAGMAVTILVSTVTLGVAMVVESLAVVHVVGSTVYATVEPGEV